MQKIRRKSIKSAIRALVFWVLVVFLTSYIVIETFMPDRTLGVFGFKPYVVLTASMEPVINQDDVVVVRRLNIDRLEEGDIITFLADINFDGNQEVVTHYVHEINQDNNTWQLRTRPHYDNPEDYSPDPWTLSEDDLLGEHWFTVPWLGLLVRFLQSPYGIAALLVNGAVIVSIVVLLKKDSKTDSNRLKKNVTEVEENESEG